MKRKLLSTALLASIALGHSIPLRASDKSQDLPALKAKKTEIENDLVALRGQDQTDATVADQLLSKQTELEDVEAQIETAELKARNQVLERAVVDQRTKDAKDAVKAAIKRGAIPAKDEAMQARWEKKCIEDPDNLELLASIPGHPALDRKVSPQRLILSAAGVQIQDDIRTVIRAFSQKEGVEAGQFYAAQIAPRWKEWADMPLRAADVAAGTLVTQRVLELLKWDFPMLSRISTNISAENGALDQAVNVHIVTPPAVVPYHTTNGYVPTATTTTDVPVTIDVHNSVPIKFNANQLAATFRRLFDEQDEAMHYSLGEDLVGALYALITTGNYTNTPVTEALIDFDRSTVIDLGTALTAAKVPLKGRTLLLNSNYYGKLVGDTVVSNLGANQQSEIITEGRLPRVHGFDVIEAPNLPTTGNLTGFAFSRSALCLAARVPTDVSKVFPGVTGGGQTSVVTNPDTGMSCLQIKHVAPVLGHAYLILAWMYGVDKGQVAGGTILRSAA